MLRKPNTQISLARLCLSLRIVEGTLNRQEMQAVHQLPRMKFRLEKVETNWAKFGRRIRSTMIRLSTTGGTFGARRISLDIT